MFPKKGPLKKSPGKIPPFSLRQVKPSSVSAAIRLALNLPAKIVQPLWQRMSPALMKSRKKQFLLSPPLLPALLPKPVSSSGRSWQRYRLGQFFLAHRVIAVFLGMFLFIFLLGVTLWAYFQPQGLIRSPALSFSDVYDDGDFPTDGVVILKSTASLRQESFEEHFRIEPEFKGSFVWNRNFTEVSFVPDQPWPAGQQYSVRILPGIASFFGKTFDSELNRSISIAQDFHLQESFPHDQFAAVSVATPLRFTFNYDSIEVADFQKNFVLEPSVPGTFQKLGRTFVFWPEKFFDYDQKIAVKIQGLSTRSGLSLSRPIDFQFSTESLAPSAHVTWNSEPLYTINSFAADSVLPIGFLKDHVPNTVHARLFRSNEDFLLKHMAAADAATQKTLFQWYLSHGRLKFVQEWEKDVKTTDVLSTALDLPIPEQGLYFLMLTGEGLEPWPVHVSVSPFRVVARQTDRQFFALLTHGRTGNPVEAADVELVAFEGDPLILVRGVTAENGVLSREDMKRQADLVLARGPDGLVVARPQRFSLASERSEWVVQGFVDRTFYRKGETVQISTLVREKEAGRYPKGGDGVTAQLQLVAEKSGAILAEKSLSVPSDGLFVESIDLFSEMPSGAYSIRLVVSDRQFLIDSFEVGDNQPLHFNLEISTDGDVFVQNELLKLRFNGKYAFDRPVAGGRIRYSLSGMRDGSERELTLDATGQAEVELPLLFAEGFSGGTVRVTATLFDTQSESSVETERLITIRPAEFTVRSLLFEQSFLSPGEITLPVQVDFFDSDEMLYELTVRGAVVRRDLPDQEIKTFQVQPDLSGYGQAHFTLDDPGWYILRLQARDRRDNLVQIQEDFWLDGRLTQAADRYKFLDIFQVYPEKKVFDSSDTARFQVRVPAAEGVIVVSVAQDRIVDILTYPVVSENMIIEIPLSNRYSPSARFFFDLALHNRILSTSLDIPVSPRAYDLTLKNSRNDDFCSSDHAGLLTLSVSDRFAQSRPARIFVAGFPRSDQSIEHSLVNLFYPKNSTDYEVNHMSPFLVEELNKPFLWEVTTADQRGVASFSVQRPVGENNLSFVAWAVSDDGFVGDEHFSTVCPDVLNLTPSLPDILHADDHLVIGVDVSNESGRDREVTVELRTEGVEVTSDARQTLIIPAGQTQRMNWSVVVAAVSEKAQFRWQFIDTDQPAVERIVPIRPVALTSLSSSFGTLPRDFSFELEKSAFDRVEVSLFSDRIQSLIPLYEALWSQPDDFYEQQAAKMLAWAVWPAQWREDKQPAVQRIVDTLLATQLSSGGWGWHVDSETFDPLRTALILLAIDEVRDSSTVTVSLASLEPALQKLEESLMNTPSLEKEIVLRRSLARFGRVDQERLVQLSSMNLTLAEQIFLAALSIELGQEKGADQFFDRLEERVFISEGKAYFLAASLGQESVFSSQVLTATALDIYLGIEPDSERVEQMVSWLDSERQASGWGHSQYAALIFPAVFSASQKTDQETDRTDYEVRLNDRLIEAGRIDAGVVRPNVFSLPSDVLVSGTNVLNMLENGDQPLFYQFRLEDSIGQYELSARENGFRLERRYEKREGDASELAVGDVLEVRLMVDNPASREYVQLEDHLPSAFSFIVPEGMEQKNSPHPVESSGQVRYFFDVLPAGKHHLTYLVRVMRQGTVRTEPARVISIYKPDVFGQSSSERFEILP